MGGGCPPEVITVVRYKPKSGSTTGAPRFVVDTTGYKQLDDVSKKALLAALGIVPTRPTDLVTGTINIHALP